MDTQDKFSDIRPYTDEETAAAMSQIAVHPFISKISQYFYPEKPAGYMSSKLKQIKTVEQLQEQVVSHVVERVLMKSSKGLTYSGTENIPHDRKVLFMSNHRDIILDPAITQLIMFKNNLPTTHICVGSNIITNQLIESLVRSNRMIKVVRGISAKELYLSSQLLSEYIRKTITEGTGSIWLAQRQGRTKDGYDVTEQGLLKMLDMSGQGSFEENYLALHILPISVSYEFEPCDIQKARELYISRRQKYVKGPNEDTMSILTGITQQKGRIHFHIGTTLTADEIAQAAACDKNERYTLLRQAVNKRVVDGYHLWPNNYIAYDILNNGNEFADKYTSEEKDYFQEYMHIQLDSVEAEIERGELTEIFLGIYANPVVAKKKLEAGEMIGN